MDERIATQTRSEWRELGFFYDRNNQSKQWIFSGSRRGLLMFAELLRAYTNNPRNALLSEHAHYGPYMYLKVMTWSKAGVDGHSIHGSLSDLKRLSELIEVAITHAKVGGITKIREAYSPASDYTLVLELRNDTFDPASADMSLTPEN